MDLKDKVCLITGGTSGIGAATARVLAQQGASLALLSRGSICTDSEDILSSLRRNGAKVLHLKGDVADGDACRDCIAETVKQLGGLDVIVHSAGGAVPGDIFTVSESDWMQAFAVHVHSIYHLTKAAVPHMKASGEGAIILLGSAAGLRGCLGAIAYGVVKGALPQFARNLARELAPHRIRVNCVSPGVIRTPFQNGLTKEQAEQNIQNRIPLRREGAPEDVAAMIAALIQNEFITGENVVLDGGMTMRIV